jgi:malate dehydrogenase (oxaloacetate-decarboxylating)(NADP+)
MFLPLPHFANSHTKIRTKGQVIFASGSPYKPFEWQGDIYEPCQGNNMYIFPGIGLGAILSKSRHVSDAMVLQAAIALSQSLNAEEIKSDLVYPRLTRIRDISAEVALAVIRNAQAEVGSLFFCCCCCLRRPLMITLILQNLDDNSNLRRLTDEALLEYIKVKMWTPGLYGTSKL